MFSLAVERLREESDATRFAIFEAYDLDDTRTRHVSRDSANGSASARRAVTNGLAAMRRRFRAIVLDVLREATASEAEYRAEVRALLGVDA